MTPIEGAARRKDHALDIHAVVRALHDLHAIPGRPATARRLEYELGNRFAQADISSVVSADSSGFVTDHGDGTYELTDAGLIEARNHPSDRSWS